MDTYRNHIDNMWRKKLLFSSNISINVYSKVWSRTRHTAHTHIHLIRPFILWKWHQLILGILFVLLILQSVWVCVAASFAVRFFGYLSHLHLPWCRLYRDHHSNQWLVFSGRFFLLSFRFFSFASSLRKKPPQCRFYFRRLAFIIFHVPCFRSKFFFDFISTFAWL